MPSAVGRSVLIYAVAFAVAGATPFLLLPILTRQLSPQQFGEVTSFLVLVLMLSNIAGLSANGFVAVRWFKAPAAQFAGLAGTTIAAIVAAHLVAALVIALLHPLLQELLGLALLPSLLAVAAALVLSVNLVWLSIFQSSGAPLLYLRARIVQATAEILLCIGLLALFAAAASARTLSYTAALALSALAGAWWCRTRGQVRFGIDREALRSLAAFGLPMLPHVVAGSALTYLDRVVVSSVLGADSLGLFMAAMQIGMVMVVLIEPLNKALAPWLFERLAKDDATVRRLIVRNTYVLYAALAAVGLAVAAAATLFFDTIVGPRYAAARPLVPWM